MNDLMDAKQGERSSVHDVPDGSFFDIEYVDRLFYAAFEEFPNSDFLVNVQNWWQEKGFITEKQALKIAAVANTPLDYKHQYVKASPSNVATANKIIAGASTAKVADNLSWTATDFSMLDTIAKHVNATSRAKGFYEKTWNIGEKIALMHCELSEALEATRLPDMTTPDKNCPEFSNLTIEFADVIIRVLDTCAEMGLPIGEAVRAKANFNSNREYQQGKVF